MRRSLLLAVLALALLPAAARATDVAQDDESGLVTIVDHTGVADDISLLPGGVIHDENGNLTDIGLGCSGDGNDMTCDNTITGYAVDLGDENDRFRGGGEPVPISVAGGNGNDDVQGGNSRDVLSGGEGNDLLRNSGGTDEYFGERGDDTIQARDNLPERISCGAGDDQADNDPVDIIAECERGVDLDGDGFSTAVDCNDANPAVSPGDPEIFGNGIDDDCDGRDNANPDVDGDGVPVPMDCDDTDRNVRPNVPEIRGNKVDENCDRRALSWRQLGATVSNQWAFAPAWTKLQRLVVISAPAGARIAVKCSGKSCPSTKTRRFRARNVLKRVVLHKGIRGKKLRPGASVKVTITAPETIGRTYTYRIARGAPPSTTITCRAPGAKRSRSC